MAPNCFPKLSPLLSLCFFFHYQWSCNIIIIILSCIAPSPSPSPLFFPYHFLPDNYVRRTETPDSHIFCVIFPGVRKEEIRVEVEDSTYMSIRTEAVDGERELATKFRLPEMVDLNGITALYVDGVLTVRVPRALVSRGFFIHLPDLPGATEVLTTARAA